METFGLVMAVCCILLVRAGQVLFQVGVTRSKNAASAGARLLCDFVVSALAFWAVGAAILLYEGKGIVGANVGMLCGDHVAVLGYLSLLLAGSGQVAGALGERSRFAIVAPLSALFAALVYPVIGHWSWVGFLKGHGLVDVGGVVPLLVPALVISLVAAKKVGARTGKYNRDGSCNAIPGHSVTLAVSGGVLLAAGWIAYLALATVMASNVELWHVALNGILASAAGAGAAMLLGVWRFGKVDILVAVLGMVSGVAGLSAGGGLLPAWAAALVGGVCGVAGPWFAIWLDIRWRVDDASGLASVMGISGVISVLGSATLTGGALGERAMALAIGLGGMALAAIVSGGAAWALLWVLGRVMTLRASEADEYDGLDLVEHDINAYPDFQQTMIKSHHLRQA